MVEAVCPLWGTSQNHPLPLLLPLTFKLRMISLAVVLAPREEVSKALPMHAPQENVNHFVIINLTFLLLLSFVTNIR